MAIFKVTLLAVAGLSLVLAQHEQHYESLPHEEIQVEEHYSAYPKYEFRYGVHDPHTNDIKEQAEKRDGDKVEGYYKLVEPDGTTRTVHYTSDKHSGFNAHVQKSGHAVHPATYHNYEQSEYVH